MFIKIPQFVLPVDETGFNDKAVLPYGLKIDHIKYAMTDFCNFLSFINTELQKNNMPIFEMFLMQANFSSIVGEFMNISIPKYCDALIKNKYHNGHPDLIEKGKFLNDSVQHSYDGIEIKASRYEKGWQGHNPENGWLMVFVFQSSRPNDATSIPFYFKAVYGAELEESDWHFAGRNDGSRRTITATVKNSGFEKMSRNWIYKHP
ncbi:MAG: hypothetical protein LBK61_03745 [Spirochaetaceae bacterium]|jgi:hypothetical protein|nr:hypothetical protein [Spirochaetaceae bacterium]